jgi:hypothetical protein
MSGSFGFTDDRNPFEDPAFLQAMRSQQQVQPANAYDTMAVGQPLPPPQPKLSNMEPAADSAAVLPTVEPPPPYSPASASWESNAAAASANEELRRRQEELERKAAELQRREEEMQRNMQFQARRNNFPPIPSSCPVQPCFYQDISVDIPLEFQKVVRTVYYLWLAYVRTLAVNIIGSLAYFIASIQNNVSNSSGMTFGLSIFYLVLFTPCSFVCWFRPLYKAFRSDSSFNFFFFFFVFFFQFCVTVLQSLGFSGWGTVGFLSSLDMFTSGSAGAHVAGVIMITIGVMFAAVAFLDMIMLIKVHRIYRNTGASFAKAQQEFAHDVMGNRTIQRAAGNFVSTGVRSSVEQTWSGSRY